LPVQIGGFINFSSKQRYLFLHLPHWPKGGNLIVSLLHQQLKAVKTSEFKDAKILQQQYVFRWIRCSSHKGGI